MKRTTYIFVGIIVIIILLVVWVLMLLTGNPENGERFANFGFGDTTDTTIVEPVVIEEVAPLVNVQDDSPLRQLTTDPIIGFVEVRENASATPRIRYAAAGTGHIFEIDLATGEETRLSNTTIPNASYAVFTPSGQSVLMRAKSGLASEFIVGLMSTSSNSLITYELSGTIASFAATDEERFLLAIETLTGSDIKMHNPATGATTDLFSLPFRDARYDWGSRTDGPHFVYPKAANRLEGYLYRIDGRTLSRVPVDGFGLTAISNSANSLFATQQNNTYVSSIYRVSDGTRSQNVIDIIPEKCVWSEVNSNEVFCAAPFEGFDERLPESWYTGELEVEDMFWRIDVAGGVGSLLIDSMNESGRAIDAVRLETGGKDNNLYFMNRLDDTLWQLVL